MILNFGEIEDGATLEADLCILGGGAAGIAIAREFIGTSTQVCLVESGGLRLEADTQSLYAGATLGRPYDLAASRLRYLGGTTNHWGGLCAPLLPVDFERRPWIPHSGWPIVLADLQPFYVRAQQLAELGPYVYDSDNWEAMGVTPYDLDRALVTYQFYRYSPPTRFGTRYRDELAAAPNIRVLLSANATNIQTTPDAGTVTHVDLKSLTGRTGRVRARTFVVACGGIENARVLLLSDTVEPNGLGNRHDVVGRFFMEHPLVSAASVITDDHFRLFETLQPIRVDGVRVRAGLFPSREAQEREGILNSNFFINYTAKPGSTDDEVRALGQMLRHGFNVNEVGERLWNISRDFDAFAYSAYRWFIEGKSVMPRRDNLISINLFATTEQAPNPDSRVTLSGERDALGLRRVALDWRLSEQDRRTVRTHAINVGREFARLGIGRVQLRDWLVEETGDWAEDMLGARHHMGTTRMSEDPRQGVVDADCRVHGVNNLYIAGSSVFPTGGAANPTLTLLALALRLADHLKDQASA